jgi:hypothetical protein
MSQEYIELRGSSVIELRRVDRIISELARPAMPEDSMSPATLEALLSIGICVAGDASRRDLIERLWGRKRSLFRQMNELGDWGPARPVA